MKPQTDVQIQVTLLRLKLGFSVTCFNRKEVIWALYT